MAYIDQPNGDYGRFMAAIFLGGDALGAIEKAMSGQFCPVGAMDRELRFEKAVNDLCGPKPTAT